MVHLLGDEEVRQKIQAKITEHFIFVIVMLKFLSSKVLMRTFPVQNFKKVNFGDHLSQIFN